ncbi:uncharacterized protein PGTG_20833 [Puccinia graminis f. sp. tritici CRL 75-36-700-3]|uniref:DNA 3'-5' helicase n=1 Tax=Puccinia graminis f. sp. tritici (strain CRL 75-36-700-3 / race SCCL) TaxID=418459 RepID=H6QPN4_PUCGT|nr:uncharacterized protein PGTG_20833 [Puccinia graminis f. sp. tritici CRL 75-36-700-3]EHS64136.1 hypothetical protein PGTG_20833 [Puccinia graminis f. sp. tritici CRL 75-36-700-3]
MSEPTLSSPSTVKISCSEPGCVQSFADDKSLKKHQREVHQHSTLCTPYATSSAPFHVHRNQDGTFHCPTKHCTWSSPIPGTFQKHVKNCNPDSFNDRPKVLPLPPSSLATLIPAGNQITLTKEFPFLGFNTYAKTLVCLDCHCGVPTKEVAGHLRSSPHKINNIIPDAIIQAFKSINVTVPLENKRTPPRASQPWKPVEGLYLKLGIICAVPHRGSICGHAVQKESSMSNHFSDIHKDGQLHLVLIQLPKVLLQSLTSSSTVPGGWASNSQRTYVQHFSNSTIRYFPVEYSAPHPAIIPAPSAAPSESQSNTSVLAWEQLSSALNKLDVLGHKQAVTISSDDAHPALVSNFLNSSGIHAHINACTDLLQCSTKELHTKVHYPNLLATWKPCVEKWLIGCMTELTSVHDAVTMEALRESVNDPPSRRPIRALQQRSTAVQYASVAAEFIVFTLETTGQPLATHFWSASNRRLSEFAEKASASLSSIQSDKTDAQGQFDRALNFLFWNSTSFSASILKRSKVQSALEQFIALSMIKPDGSFFSPSNLTHTIAALQYVIRVATVFACLEGTEEIYAHPPSDIDPKDHHLLEQSAISTYFQFIYDEKLISPFFTIRNWMRLASTIVMNEKPPDPTYWADSEMTKLVIGPTQITITAVQRALRIAICSINSVIQHTLHGASFPDFLYSKLDDQSANTSLGFNYLVASANEQMYHFKLLKDWVLNGSSPPNVLSPAWTSAMRLENGHYSLNLDQLCSKKHAWDWLESADLILEHIYFIYHVGCGQPARGTEEAAMLIRNIDSAPRNIYWRETRFMFQTYYHKGQNISNRSKPRQVFLTADLSMHLHNYLAYIRPVQILVIIQPLKALVDQTVNDFKKLKTVTVQHFEKGNFIDPLAQVIIVTTNQAADSHFCNQLRSCLPTRIIIDEAHSFLEDGYRGYMPGVTALTQLSTQLILTTASLPHSQEDDLLRITFGLRRLITKRQPTFRPELNIEVLRSPAKWEQLSSVIQPLINSFLLGPKDRAMIFIENKNAVELVGPQIEAVIHHSDLPDDVAAAAVEKWTSGGARSIVATSGFGTGINYLHVRLVCIYGIPNRATANKAYQQLGRAGRDGHQAHIFFIPTVSDPHGDIDDFKKNLMNPAVCPANTFAQHQDNLNWSCRNFPTFLSCVCCSRLSANPALLPSTLSLSQPSSIPDWSPDPSAPSNSYNSSSTVSAQATLGAHVGSGLAQSRKRRRLEDTDPLADKLATSNTLAAESSLSITSLARSAEQARLQSMPDNRVNSNQINRDNSLISHELWDPGR